MENEGSNDLENRDLINGKGREKTGKMFEVLTAFPFHVPYAERMAELAARSGISLKLLNQTARRNDWRKRLELIVAEQTKQQQLGKLFDTAAAGPNSLEIPFSTLAKGIKTLSFISLNASLQYVSTTALLIDFYAKKINHAIAQAGGVSRLDTETAGRVKHYNQELAQATKAIADWIKPTALQALLGIINFSSQLPADDSERDVSAFTIDTLYTKLKELGMLSAFDRPDAAVADFLPPEGLPEIGDETFLASDSE